MNFSFRLIMYSNHFTVLAVNLIFIDHLNDKSCTYDLDLHITSTFRIPNVTNLFRHGLYIIYYM